MDTGKRLYVTGYIIALAQICATLFALQAYSDDRSQNVPKMGIRSFSEFLTGAGDSRPLPPDRSLSASDYIQRGLPSYDRMWSGADMARAASILTSISNNDPGKLPRYQSDRSGILFARITADENLSLYRNRSLPIEQRMPEALSYIQSSSTILKLYLKSYNQGVTGDSELVEIVASQLRMWLAFMPLVDEFLPTLDKNDPSYPIRMGGLSKIKNGLATAVAGTVESLTERQPYRTSELKRMASYTRQTLPQLLPYVPQGTRVETLVRLRSFRSDPAMNDLNPELAELVNAVEEASRPMDR